MGIPLPDTKLPMANTPKTPTAYAELEPTPIKIEGVNTIEFGFINISDTVGVITVNLLPKFDWNEFDKATSTIRDLYESKPQVHMIINCRNMAIKIGFHKKVQTHMGAGERSEIIMFEYLGPQHKVGLYDSNPVVSGTVGTLRFLLQRRPTASCMRSFRTRQEALEFVLEDANKLE